MVSPQRTDIHTIGIVARYCGLSPEVIRAWENRYSAISPQRSKRGQRIYSDTDLQRLALLARVCRGGHRIGDIVHLSDAKLLDIIEQDEAIDEPIIVQHRRQSTAQVMEYIESCIVAINHFDFHTLFRILAGAEKSLGTVFMIEDLLTPLIAYIRDECRRGNLSDSHRKVFNSLIKSYLMMLGTRQAKERCTAIVCSLENDSDLSGLKTFATVAAYKWHPIYLDAETSIEDLSEIIDRAEAKVAVFVTCGSETNDNAPNLLRKIRQREANVNIILYAPMGNSYRDVIKGISLVKCKRLNQLQSELDRLMLL